LIIVIIALAVLSSLTSGMIEVAGQFLEAVKAKDVAQARTWLSSEAQAATDENALRQFLVNLEVLGFGTANWPVRQILYEARRPLTPDEISEVEVRASKWQPKSARTAN